MGAALQHDHPVFEAALHDLVPELVVRQIDGAHEAATAGVGDDRESLLHRVKPGQELRAPLGGVGQELLVLDDLEDVRGAHHVHQAAAEGAVDAARHVEDVVLHLVEARAREHAAELHLLGETQDVRHHTEVLVGPPLAGEAHARLDFVEDQERFAFVGDAPQLVQELASEVVVAAFGLDGLDQDGGDVVGVLVEGLLDLAQRSLLGLDHLGEVGALEREADGWGRYARPGELREQIGLHRIGVGDRERVAAATVEGVFEVQDLLALVAGLAGGAVLLHLPVEGRLHGVFDGEGSAVDEEEVGQLGGRRGARQRVDELRHVARVVVGVRHLLHAGRGDPRGHVRVEHARVIHADRVRGEEAEEVEVQPPADQIADPALFAVFEVDDHRVAVHQHVLSERGVDVGGLDF